ncbi:hypothetical protein ACPA9J_08240 [Pseudomonas aeruginosa]
MYRRLIEAHSTGPRRGSRSAIDHRHQCREPRPAERRLESAGIRLKRRNRVDPDPHHRPG